MLYKGDNFIGERGCIGPDVSVAFISIFYALIINTILLPLYLNDYPQTLNNPKINKWAG